MIKPVILIIISVFLSVLGQVNLKQGMLIVNSQINKTSVVNQPEVQSDLPEKAKRIVILLFKAFITPRIIFGIFCYFCSMMLWLIVLSKVELSFAYPLLGVSYILVVISAAFILKEHISLGRWIGTGIIFIGIVLVARS